VGYIKSVTDEEMNCIVFEKVINGQGILRQFFNLFSNAQNLKCL
jgi:hypothetical protein